jgi:GDP/UDP-N,N'-diacetylbacillosamine 2-epimerase (hydrolysing)
LKVAVLTSSRADYSLYLPLLKKMRADNFFDLRLIAFGTHVSKQYGHTIDEIYKDGFEVAYTVDTIPAYSNPQTISKAMGETIVKFSEVWAKEASDLELIICLGDRYEMFAAVSASVPFTIPVAHLYGGDTTLGAIDDLFRHSITAMSTYHFTSINSSAKRVEQLKGAATNIYVVGSLSLDNLNELPLLTKAEFKAQFGIDLNDPVLLTFHPETIAHEKNETYIQELLAALETLDKQLVITMPNADTMGQVIREALMVFAKNKKNVYTVESLGTIGYFSCIHHCDFMIGNSSSGIVEAASFGKYVINLGDRQKGRETGKNVIHCAIEQHAISKAIKSIPAFPLLDKTNIYGDGKSSA